MRHIRSFITIAALAALVALVAVTASAQSDMALSRRAPVSCPPATPYPFYNPTVTAAHPIIGWYCTATEPVVFNGSTLTATAAEINQVHSVTPGTAAASKVAVLGANKNLDILVLPVGGLFIGPAAGTAVTATAAELNLNHTITPGTATASKVVVLDANVALAGLKTALGGAVTTTPGTMVGGLTDSTTTTSGTTQNQFYTLNSVTIPASAFNANGRAIHCGAWGTTAANANAKDFKITVGSATLYTITAVTLSGKAFYASFDVVRTGSNTQSGGGQISFDMPYSATFSGAGQSTGAAQTDTSAIIIAIQSQNTAAAAASATGNGMVCTFVN